MGQNELGILHRQTVTIQEIQIDGPRAVARMVIGTAQNGFDLKEVPQEFIRREMGRNLDYGIEKWFRVTSAVDRSCFKDPRSEDRLGSLMQVEQFPAGGLEVKQARLDVGPEGDACSHKAVSR